jgi:VWFA-related protein
LSRACRVCSAAAAAALLTAVAGSTTARAQPPPQSAPIVFRSGVELVRVDALVAREGGIVKGLKPSDFELRDNGVVQEVASASLEQIPIDALLVLDLSGSVTRYNAERLRGAASTFLDGLTARDRAALLTFNARTVLAQPLTGDLRLVRERLAGIEGGGSTALNDGIYAALRFREPGATRGAVIVFTDGVDNISWLSADDVVETAKRSDVIVHAVVSSIPGIDLRAADNPLLHSLGHETGGLVWSAGWSKLGGAFRAVLDDLRSRYLLTYYPAGVAASGWHSLDVKLKSGGAKVTARTGYYRPAPRPGQ